MKNNNTNDTTTKKLTLGGSKLKLKSSVGNKLSISSGNKSSISSNMIVEVKRGKAINKTEISSSQIARDDKQDGVEHSDRRLEALKRSQADSGKENISTLSRIAALNSSFVESKVDADNDDSGENVDVINSQETASIVVDESDENLAKKPITERPLSSSGAAVKDSVSVVKKEITIKDDKDKSSKVKPSKGPVVETKSDLEEKEFQANLKNYEAKKLKKSDIFNMISEDDSGQIKTRSMAALKRAREKQRRKNELRNNQQDKVYRVVPIAETIEVSDLAAKMSERVADVVRELMKLGVMATGSQSIDADTAEIIVEGFGHTPKRIKESYVEDVLLEDDNPELQRPRAPVVTVMGHVDHGKTSLLDALKETDVAKGEAGGITQHIGAYSVKMPSGKMITFIDTPGHAAFTEMRVRGANVTDVVVLVVAADDGIKTQTIEAINHAKAANVPIIVAINKIDKPGADITKVKNELLMHSLIPEDLGGDIITVPVSALKRTNLAQLEETILLVAEMQDLRAVAEGPASGVVIDSKIDKAQGVIATILVQRGNLKIADIAVAGTTYGRVRKMRNDKGRKVESAGPSMAVEIFGLNQPPSAGDSFNIVPSEKQARDIAEYREKKIKQSQVTSIKVPLEELFQKASGNNKIKELALIIKGDVHGSIEAISSSLGQIDNDEVKLKILHSAVGGITESDIGLAAATGAFTIGFNVRANNAAAALAADQGVDIRYYSVIYNLIDDIRMILSGMLSPILRENYIGSVEIRQVFNITKIGKIAGSYVTKGIIRRGSNVRLLREDVVIHEGKLKTLKRFKEEVKELREGFECGIAFENYEDIRVGDKVEVFEIVEEKKQL